MLARDHALSGAIVGLALVDPLAHLLGHVALRPGQLAAVAAVTAGFALFPDIDEPGSTISRKLGPLSRGVATMTRRLAGGHRQATHSLAFAAVVGTAVCTVSGTVYAGPILLAASLGLTLALIVPGHLIRRGGWIALLTPLLAGAALLHGETGRWAPGSNLVLAHPVWWLPLAATLGVVCHLAGDTLTAEGVPWLWGLTRHHFALPLIGHTASARETLVGVGLSAALLVLIWVSLLRPELGLLHNHLAAALGGLR